METALFTSCTHTVDLLEAVQLLLVCRSAEHIKKKEQSRKRKENGKSRKREIKQNNIKNVSNVFILMSRY